MFNRFYWAAKLECPNNQFEYVDTKGIIVKASHQAIISYGYSQTIETGVILKPDVSCCLILTGINSTITDSVIVLGPNQKYELNINITNTEENPHLTIYQGSPIAKLIIIKNVDLELKQISLDTLEDLL